ncbi:MAG: hypothetical protein M9962_06620 [Oligoflexia bacterium]|nr:hypothetical protein [Oligoflexia bacterium]
MQQEIQVPRRINMVSTGKDANWLKRLVDNEVELLKTGSGDFVSHQDHKKVVEEATLEFMFNLKEEFLKCVDLFNSYRGGSHLPNSIKIFNISNTQADFIIFRNTLKLVISNPALGVVNFSFVNRANTFSKAPVKTKREGYDLIAQLYPFNDLAWTFHGERIDVEAVVRYLFTDFVKSSAIF